MSAPETPATPGQAAPAALFARWYRVGKPAASDDEVEHAWRISGSLHQEFWADFAVAVASEGAARQPQPAPGLRMSVRTALLEYLRELVDCQSIAADGCPKCNRHADEVLAIVTREQPAPELGAAPELRAAMRETSKVQDVAARMLSWFGGDGTRRHAAATRAQLAHAYRDSGLTVPEELRRFL